ncbi:MAG: cysteine hydrolase [Thermomicrobiales bacterium]|nr:cysteine hydrolase [Thermomicrobiales bacterium]
MTTQGNPEKSALLVIDVQNGVVASAWQRDDVVANINAVVARAREQEIPVIWIQHEAEDLPRDSEEWQIVPELVPGDGDLHVYKEYSDSFAATDLQQTLNDLGIGHLVITGAQTNACVRATTYRAAGEGYDVTLVGDAHTTDDISWNGYELSAKAMIDDLNLTLSFIEWPNQKVQSTTAAEVLNG